MDLAPPVNKALSKLNIHEPTAVQSAVMTRVLAGKDLLVSAHTGSGKTLAFVLPLINRFSGHRTPYTGTRALVLAPTRELARQIQHVCERLGAAVHVQSATLTGGVAFREQEAILRKVPDLVIATPGRLREHLDRNTLDLSDLECVVLDEADRMLDMGFRDEVRAILDQCPAERQTLLFSATLDHKGVTDLADQLLKEPETLAMNASRSVPDNIRQDYVLADDVPFKQKLATALLDRHPDQQIIFFTNTILRAQSLQSYLSRPDIRCALLHGDLTQDQRNAVVAGMRDGRYRVLVTTDVAARGLDLPNVGLVVNFDLARKGDEYLHRVGRTGRAGQPGHAVSLIAPNEWNLMISIQNYLKTTFSRLDLPGLKSRYQGPEKLRKSGKAYGKKKKPKAESKTGRNRPKDKTAGKEKVRARDTRNKGKRPPGDNQQEQNRDGLAPLKRKPRPEE